MKPTVIANANSSATTGGNGVTIPISHEHRGQTINQRQQQPHFNTQAQHFAVNEPQGTVYGSPGSLRRAQRQHQQPHTQQQESPSNFQDFDFEPEVFPRTRLGRMTHDRFGDFGGPTPDFGFPQFNSLGRRRINPHNDDDFFDRLPSEFRQYIPEGFAHRRAGSGMTGNPGSAPQPATQQEPQTNFCNTTPQSLPRKVCDAAIQTDDPKGRSEVDKSINTENLYQYGLRNTMDMGVKSPTENENQSPRSSSAPPTEHQNLQQHIQYTTQPQQISVNGPKRQTPPPQQQNQFATQTTPHIESGGHGIQSPQLQKNLYASQQQAHPQQRQQTSSPPQTPGGSYIRTIPIFVEGRTEPIINNKEIPNQNAQPNFTPGSGNGRAFTPPKQQGHRPTRLNTQQKPTTPNSSSITPQTPHTVDTINKIQDIQHDVLDLMSSVENFTGTRADKEYAYLDEMLTRNLLKLDNIDTNGKDSIRLARKEAIKCIQASINVLEAKAEENRKGTQFSVEANEVSNRADRIQEAVSLVPAESVTKESIPTAVAELINELADNTINEPLPQPPPECEKFNEVKIEDCPEDDISTTFINEKSITKVEDTLKTESTKSK